MSENNAYEENQKPLSRAGVICSRVSEQEKVSPKERVKARFAAMTRRQRLEYLWEYYKWVPLTLIAVTAVVLFLVSLAKGSGREQLAYGVVINIAATDSQLGDMMKDATAAAGGDLGRQEVLIEGQLAVDTGDAADPQPDGSYEMACKTKIGVSIYAGDLDFMIAPEATVAVYMQNGVLADLSGYADAAALGDRVLYSPEGLAYAIVLRAEDMNGSYGEMFDGCCFSMINNGRNKKTAADVLKMLMGEGIE